MGKVSKIFDRLTIKHVKQRTLVTCLAVQNITLALIVLIITNIILSNNIRTGQLNYMHIRLFYTFCLLILFLIPYILVPIFSSRTINSMYNNNVVDNLLSSGVMASDIVYASYLRGLSFSIIMIASAIPITSISFYFGGMSINMILKIYLVIILFAVFFSAICTYISARVFDVNVATIISYVVGLVALIGTLMAVNAITADIRYLISYAILSLIVSILLINMAKYSLQKY